MLSDLLDRLSIHQIALSGGSVNRAEGVFFSLGQDLDLTYRLGRGSDNKIEFVVSETDDGEQLVIYRFTIVLACKVFEQSVLNDAPEIDDIENLDTVCEVHAQYDADYTVKDGTGEDDEFERADIESFAEHNVPYHVWPYFREHLSSSLAKMQVAPITVPMLMVRPENQKPCD